MTLASLSGAFVAFPDGRSVGSLTVSVPDAPGVTAFTGPACAGKSTAVAMLLGIVTPGAGLARPADPETTRVVAFAHPVEGDPRPDLPVATSTVAEGVRLVDTDDLAYGLCAPEAPAVERLAETVRVVSATHDRGTVALADEAVALPAAAPGRERCTASTLAPVLLDGAAAFAMHPADVPVMRSLGFDPAPVLVPVEVWATLHRALYI